MTNTNKKIEAINGSELTALIRQAGTSPITWSPNQQTATITNSVNPDFLAVDTLWEPSELEESVYQEIAEQCNCEVEDLDNWASYKEVDSSNNYDTYITFYNG
jgi:hypothetical protein